MTRRIRWWSRDDALEIHARMLDRHGGMAGVRDDGMLESALAKPLNLQAYASPSLFEMAAAYASGVILNHPFIDGNKRTGFMLAAGFLQINGIHFNADPVDAVIKTLALAVRELDAEAYARWLEQSSVDRREPEENA